MACQGCASLASFARFSPWPCRVHLEHRPGHGLHIGAQRAPYDRTDKALTSFEVPHWLHQRDEACPGISIPGRLISHILFIFFILRIFGFVFAVFNTASAVVAHRSRHDLPGLCIFGFVRAISGARGGGLPIQRVQQDRPGVPHFWLRSRGLRPRDEAFPASAYVTGPAKPRSLASFARGSVNPDRFVFSFNRTCAKPTGRMPMPRDDRCNLPSSSAPQPSLHEPYVPSLPCLRWILPLLTGWSRFAKP